jgi:hypothetical protein
VAPAAVLGDFQRGRQGQNIPADVPCTRDVVRENAAGPGAQAADPASFVVTPPI